MRGMFRTCPSFNQNLAWNTNRVRDMSQMFMHATSFNGELNFSSTSQVTDMTEMFRHAALFQGNGLFSFDTSAVTSMKSMFRGAYSFRGDSIEDWNVQNVMDFTYMFTGAKMFIKSLCSWWVQLHTNAATDHMFAGTSRFDTKTVFTEVHCYNQSQPTPQSATFMLNSFGQALGSREELLNAVDAYMIDRTSSSAVAAKYGYPIGNWNVRSIDDFSSVFSAARNPLMYYFDEELPNWDMQSAKNTSRMFEGCVSLSDGASNSLSDWNVSNVIDMSAMFESSSFSGENNLFYIFVNKTDLECGSTHTSK
jgi:hypothetical protein